MLTVEEKDKMKNEALKVSEALYDFLVYIDNDSCVAPDEVQQFLLCLCSASPVCSYIHFNASVKKLIADIVAGVNVKEVPTAWNALYEEIPVLYNMLSSPSVTRVPPPVVDLLAELWRKSECTYNTTLPNRDDSMSVCEDDLANYPNLPKIRHRGCYTADISKTTKDSASCNKKYNGHPTLLPGIFTIYCKHG
jgi:hypothetical protein